MGDRDFSRLERVGDQIQRVLAEIIATELVDRRIPNLTVTGVKVARDLRSATVLITPPQGADPEQTLGALRRAGGFLRRRLGEQIRLKYLPRLHFEYDATLDQADRLARLLDGTEMPTDDPPRR